MSGGARYWNEETQRWEDDAARGAPTPPPPARPDFAPTWPPAAGPGDPTGDAPASTASTASTASAGGDEAADGASGAAGPPPDAWPAGGARTAWHEPGTAPSPALTTAENATWPPTAWPPTDELQVPAPAGGFSRRFMWSVLIGAVVVGVAVSLVLTVVIGSDDDNKPVVATSSLTPSPTTAPPSPTTDPTTPSSSPSPSPSVSTPPAGYESTQDEEGFRIAVPEGWTRSTVASTHGIAVVNYRSSDNQHRLQIYQVAEESPAASFRLYLSDETPKPAGFEKLSLDTLDDAGFTGSRLEYLADRLKGEPDIGTWHVYDERFVAADGNIYAIAAYGPEADGRADELEVLSTAVDWFCPSLGGCDDPAAVD